MVQRRASLKPIILKLNETDCWKYRGEGKTGLVVTNNCGLALKLRKGIRENDYLYLYTRNLLYVEVCIAPIFGPFLCYGQVTKLPTNLAATVVSKIQNRRSSLKHSNIDVKCPYALMMPDACALPGHNNIITIEIKPKAYLRTTGKQQAPIKCCRFCSNIEKRYNTGLIPAQTQYCPRDFFSPRASKVAQAINALFDEPLSYMTIHKDNLRIFDEDNKNIEEILSPQSYRTRNELINVIVKILLSKRTSSNRNVLQVIEEAQKINMLSIPDLCQIYSRFSSKGLDIDIEIGRWLAGESTLSEEFLRLLDLIIKFSISIIAQDISIMISISSTSDNSLPQIITNGRVYSYKVSIVDVDYKSVKKLPKYLLQEKELCVSENASNHSNHTSNHCMQTKNGDHDGECENGETKS
ncbi:inositol-pentakisphosphate 2-kinase-like [Bolinopsis microptera]|uniref:inositol-pentakisphosphate 2-kinase-like n=1 Tax=Bolinopsis microptera TaxID=2820187 RepID=UPI00307922CD